MPVNQDIQGALANTLFGDFDIKPHACHAVACGLSFHQWGVWLKTASVRRKVGLGAHDDGTTV
ncbi:hypothetical protein D3C84_1060920 [compost metagenome]